ncbi:protein angel homolog 1 isoform X1 [Colossoma macropomum]|uniref:protein angel homolog 1 isoform X1 n=1 Tax=Colossoma macropomum TaxID=42526 RepID=UPI00186550C7|nr:protein angel homolog 1 isoform X1 [Colossoma macropomum]
MIGSLIYYALFPLTKLIGRLSESWWKVHPGHPVFINGKEVWDGGGAPFRRLSEQQTALLDQWRSTGSEPLEKPKPANQERGNAEGLVEGRFVLEREEVAEVKQEQEEDLLHKDTGNIWSADPAGPDPESSEEARAFSSVMENDASDLPEVKKEETILSGNENDGLNIMLHEKEEVEKELFSTIAAPALGSEGEVSSEEERMNHKEIDAMTADAQPEEKSTDTGESEAQVNEGSSVFNLSALLADGHAESLNSFTQFQSVPAGWHFPVGLGLSEAVCYPSVQFPGMSYYPAFQENNNLEVMWRVWEDLSETAPYSIAPPTACADLCNKFAFTVMSYNILAQDLLEANSELYLHCSEGMLAWENRLHAILKELQTWEPDIVCLQEVQENHFLEQIHPVLTEMGYICVYKQRTGTKTDGCAVCYHGDRFIQLSVSLLEFRRHDCELLDRDNVGIVLLLQPISEHGEGLQFSPICVANTHLLFNPRRGDVKLAQLAIMLAEIDSVIRQCKTKGSDCEVVLCGDLNSLPNMPLYQLIATGQLYYHGLPAWMVSGQEDLSYKIHHRRLYAPLWPSSLGINDNCQYSSVCEPHTRSSGKLQYNHDFLRQLRYCQAACVRPADLEFIPGVTDNKPNPEEKQLFSPSRFRNTICHELNLSSVYSPYIADTERCAVTTLHSEGAAMVDYIFYSSRRGFSEDHKEGRNGLKLLGRLALLSEADLWSMNGLPNEMFPSDHLSLLAKFQLG